MNSKKRFAARKPLKRLNSSSFCIEKGIKMVIAMTEENPDKNGDISKDFLSTGRTGRRNAIADVLNDQKCVTFSDLPYKLERMTTNDVNETSSNSQNGSSLTTLNTTTTSTLVTSTTTSS